MNALAQPAALAHLALLHVAALLLVRAEEAWEPVLLGGMIPILGAGAIFWLIWYAVRARPDDDEKPSDDEP